MGRSNFIGDHYTLDFNCVEVFDRVSIKSILSRLFDQKCLFFPNILRLSIRQVSSLSLLKILNNIQYQRIKDTLSYIWTSSGHRKLTELCPTCAVTERWQFSRIAVVQIAVAIFRRRKSFDTHGPGEKEKERNA